MKQLSKREKVLISVLFILLLGCAFFFFFLVPQREKLAINQVQLETALVQKQAMENAINQNNITTAKIEELEDILADKAKFINPMMDNEKLDEKYQALFNQANLSIIQMTLSDSVISNFDPQSQMVTEAKKYYPLKEYLYALKNIQEENPTINLPQEQLLVMNVTHISFIYTEDKAAQLIGLIDQLDQTTYITGFVKQIEAENIIGTIELTTFMSEGLE